MLVLKMGTGEREREKPRHTAKRKAMLDGLAVVCLGARRFLGW